MAAIFFNTVNWHSFEFLISLYQENLEMVIKNGTHRLVGFVDLGEGHDLMNSLAGRVRVHFYYIEVQELQKWQSLGKKNHIEFTAEHPTEK